MEELHKPRVSWRWRDAIEADAAVGAAADAAATPRVFGGLGSGIGRADDLDLAISSTSRKLPTPVHHLDKEISDSGPPLTTLGLGNTLRVGAYNGRLTACLRDGQLTRAVALFEEMGVRGVPKNSHTLALGAEAMARCTTQMEWVYIATESFCPIATTLILLPPPRSASANRPPSFFPALEIGHTITQPPLFLLLAPPFPPPRAASASGFGLWSVLRSFDVVTDPPVAI